MNTKKREFIDPNELMRYINEKHCYSGLPMAAHICTMELLTYAPRVDAVEVVRCRDCKYFELNLFDGCEVCTHISGYVRPDFGCVDGERKVDG
jgi:hypothetical protein